MKRILGGLCILVIFAFFVGCSVDHSFSLNNDQAVQTVGDCTIHFGINFNTENVLAKTALLGDGLTIAERKALLKHLKSRVSSIGL
jgi:hypothetical protein